MIINYVFQENGAILFLSNNRFRHSNIRIIFLEKKILDFLGKIVHSKENRANAKL